MLCSGFVDEDGRAVYIFKCLPGKLKYAALKGKFPNDRTAERKMARARAKFDPEAGPGNQRPHARRWAGHGARLEGRLAAAALVPLLRRRPALVQPRRLPREYVKSLPTVTGAQVFGSI